MKRFALTSAIAASVTLLGASIASADIIVGTAGNGWQAFPGTLTNYSNSTRPFWDNPSADLSATVGAPLNIGNYLQGPTFTDPFAGPVTSPMITPNWWGHAGPNTFNFDYNMSFTRGASVGPITATLIMKAAQNTSIDAAGWYDVDDPADKTLLWSSSVTPSDPGATVVFTPTTNWGFYFTGADGTYYTDSLLNTSNVLDQHFAVFQTSSTPGNEQYTVGVEDLNSNSSLEGLGDFNDFVFSFQSVGGGAVPPTPEPASLGILGAGAVALLMRRRK